MAKYIVKTRCHGFRRRIWEVGQIVDIDPTENPPHHFVRIKDDATQKVEEKVSDQQPLSSFGKTPEVKGGMASSMKDVVTPIQRPMRRGKKTKK